MVLHELGIPYDFVRTSTSMLASDASVYGGNPLLRIPTLVIDGGATSLIETDHIARYLVGRYDPADRLGVRSERPEDLNRVAVANGVMSDEATLLFARWYGGISALDAPPYFKKLADAIDLGLAWLEERAPAADDAAFDYGDLVTVCMFQHLVFLSFVPDLEKKYPRLTARVAHLASRPSVLATSPAVALAEAAAAGWTAA